MLNYYFVTNTLFWCSDLMYWLKITAHTSISSTTSITVYICTVLQNPIKSFVSTCFVFYTTCCNNFVCLILKQNFKEKRKAVFNTFYLLLSVYYLSLFIYHSCTEINLVQFSVLIFRLVAWKIYVKLSLKDNTISACWMIWWWLYFNF